MQGQLGTRPARAEGLRQRQHLRGVGHASGVAQRDAAHAQVDKTLGPGQHHVLRYLAFHGASKRTRQRNVDRRRATVRQLNHGRQRRERLRAGHAQIGQVVRLAGRHDQVELVSACIDGALGAAHVGHQAGVDDARRAADLAQHDFGVAQRWNGLGRDKGRDFDLGHAAVRERVDKGDLVLRRHKHGLVLQAVAHAHFLDIDAPLRTLPHAGRAHATTPFARKSAICSLLSPASFRTSSVSSPRCGADERIVPGVSDNLGTMPGTSTL